MDVCYSGFFIPRLVLLTFQFTPRNNVSLYTKILEGSGANTVGVETLSPIASATTGCLYFPIFVMELL